MLVVKGLEEHGVTGPAVELILAMMVVEDLLSILLLAVLTGVATGAGLSADELAGTLAKLGGLLVVMVIGGMVIVPRTIRLVAKFKRSELLLVASLAVCFGMVWVAVRAGYSIALGAFVGGMLIAESGKGNDVDALVRPFRDIFAAIFFLSIGMVIVPAEIAEHWLAAIIVAVVLVVGKTIGVTIAAFLTGNGLRRAVQAGLSLSQIGEFAFIVVALGISAGVVRGFVLPIVVGASCMTAISGSWQIRASGKLASWIDARLPKPIATFVSFYESWIGQLRAVPRPDTIWHRLRRPLTLLLVDAVIVAVVVIGAGATHVKIVGWLIERGLDDRIALALVILVAGASAGLFVVGIARRAARLARMLAALMIPRTGTHAESDVPAPGAPTDHGRDHGPDLGTSPRRALVLVLELAIVLVIGLPLAAVTQPFVPGGGLVVLVVIAVIALAANRSITDFESHVRAGSALIVELLGRQSSEPSAPPKLSEVESLLPGFSGVTPIVLARGAPSIGQCLAELDLRAKTGASVLAITRNGGGSANPSPQEPLHEGDVLAVAGSTEAVAAAREVLLGTSL
jgi:CPA2 family monovalent cation:H+ antiporter-2